ncbi:MAG TPA: hypothetical protein VN229_16690 [Terriglobales bacterium]|nr:hypothetical protein [Terriglobales bacterium]
MSAAKIPSIRERMRRQEILTRELGGPTVEINTRMSNPATSKRGSERAQLRLSGRSKPGIRDAGYQIDRRVDRPARPGLPVFANLIRKVIAY